MCLGFNSNNRRVNQVNVSNRVLRRKFDTAKFRALSCLVRPLHVLIVSSSNWAGIRWNKVFGGSYWTQKLYRVHHRSVLDLIGGTWPVSEPHPAIDSDYTLVTHHTYSLWELCKTGILASLECTELGEPLSCRARTVINYYYSVMQRLIDGFEAYLDQQPIDTVIVSQGCSPMSRPFVEIARRRGINVVATENSFLGGYFICDNATGMVVNRHRAARLAGDYLPAQMLTPEERVEFRQRFADARTSKLGEHNTGAADSSAQFTAIMERARGRRLALFLGQVMVDASIIMDGGHFTNPVRLIRRCIEYFQQHPDWYLIIRLHPKEHTGLNWVNTVDTFGVPSLEPVGPLPYNDLTLRLLVEQLGREQGDNYEIIVTPAVSTDKLMDLADIGITITSQAGLEMATKYKRVVVCGDAFYSRKGFTHEVARSELLEPTLEASIHQLELTENERLAVDRFSKYLLDEFLFRRDMRGGWERFYHMIEGGRALGLRRQVLLKAVAQMEVLSRNGTIFS